MQSGFYHFTDSILTLAHICFNDVNILFALVCILSMFMPCTVTVVPYLKPGCSNKKLYLFQPMCVTVLDIILS